MINNWLQHFSPDDLESELVEAGFWLRENVPTSQVSITMKNRTNLRSLLKSLRLDRHRTMSYTRMGSRLCSISAGDECVTDISAYASFASQPRRV
jgi:hypothetical protein